MFKNASLSDTELLYIADAKNHVIRAMTAVCSKVCVYTHSSTRMQMYAYQAAEQGHLTWDSTHDTAYTLRN